MSETQVSAVADAVYTKLNNAVAAAATAASLGDYGKVRKKLQVADGFAEALEMAQAAFQALNNAP